MDENEMEQEEISLPIVLKISEINSVLNTLAELPFKVSGGLIINIKNQAQSQINEMQQAGQEPPAE